MIYLGIFQRCLCNLGYKYKNVYKNVFVDKHKWSNVIKNCRNFVRKIERLKPYMIKVDKNDIIKSKIYYFNWKIKKKNW